MQTCVHKDCKAYSFIRELKRPIKLDDEYQCVWDEPKIKKTRYDKLIGKLDFWTQNFTTENKLNQCMIGSKVQTGNFVLDSTLYVTCKMHQPFVFCPSSSTIGIEKVGTEQETTIHYKILANNPPYAFIKDKKLQRFQYEYNILNDHQTMDALVYHDYTIQTNLDNFYS
ncbi:uncharacterized protein NPIL_204801 [Nephila pilipes]|uniref:Uncharacterized protein n=1 Tax=Nephila pilipes TaxID=299642 RepID=A0A8X6P9N1_NEPPI|nr:uncharacterized protein NPIL_204801 [Nephila pilipes]